MAGIFLPLPSFSYAEKSENQATVSVTVLEHITYYQKNSGEISYSTNVNNGISVSDVFEKDIKKRAITVKI